MKKTLFTIFLFVFALQLSQAQEYHQMLGDTVVWYQTSISNGTNTEIYTTMGDNIYANNLSYRLIVQKLPHNNNYVFLHILLREDTIEKKVYAKPYYTINIDTEFVLYDFSLNAGDSIFVCNVSPSYIYPISWYHVDSIGTYNTLIDTRKAMYLSSTIDGINYQPVWVEGIGCLAGLTKNDVQVSSDFTNCYIRNDSLIYESEFAIYYSNCDLYVGINDPQNQSEYTISPNPCSEKINFTKANNNTVTIELIDIYGQIMKQYKINNISTELDVSNLTSGVYILRIKDGKNKIFIKKIIKN